MGTRGAGSNKGNIAGGVAILAAILAIIAVIVNQLIVYKADILGVENSASIGWNKITTCTEIGDFCTDFEYADGCDVDDDSDYCTYLNASKTWLAFNVIGAVAFLIGGGAIFMGKGDKLGKGGAAIGVLCIFIALMVYYIVADDVGFWNSDADGINMGASGYLDVVAGVAGIVAAGMA